MPEIVSALAATAHKSGQAIKRVWQSRILSHPAVIWILLGLGLTLFALVRPFDHDESQYIAAASLAPTMLPYRDFAYLQTPLQPLLFAPLGHLMQGWLVPGLRIVSALLGLLTLWLVYSSQRELGVEGRRALLATLLLAACDSFLFAAASTRNDILPAMLATASIATMLRIGRTRYPRIFALASGGAMIAAVAAKISYAIPLAAMMAFHIAEYIPHRRQASPLWTVAGCAPIGVAVLALIAQAPENALFGILTFPIKAPALWYTEIGAGWKLTFSAKLLDMLKFLALGPALPMLVLVVRDRLRLGLVGSRSEWLLDVMIVGGIAAAITPTPVWRQYLLPVLPALFMRFGIMRDRSVGLRIGIVFSIFTAAGLAFSGMALWDTVVKWQIPVLAATATAHKIGALIGCGTDDRSIAGLSPQLWIDSGCRIDHRFAGGPFLFRTTGLMTQDEERKLHIISRSNIDGMTAGLPPGAIIIGGEPSLIAGQPDLDAIIERAAIEHGYVLASERLDQLRVYVPKH